MQPATVGQGVNACIADVAVWHCPCRGLTADGGVVEQVRENLGGETAQDIVETTSLSARRLYDRFRAETSMTVSAYLREVRLTAAASLLTETSAPLDAIAERVGFCDTSHLSRRFVERFGVSPGAYRRVSGRE
ncbi:MAG: helix-turn-helix domain-containing protein [Candidatus Rokuibacteriota bacterium]